MNTPRCLIQEKRQENSRRFAPCPVFLFRSYHILDENGELWLKELELASLFSVIVRNSNDKLKI